MTTKAATEIRDTTTEVNSRRSSTGGTTRADLAAQAWQATAQPPTATALTAAPSTFTQASKQVSSVAAQAPPAEVSPPTPQNVVSSVLASLGLGPLATNGPVAPVEPPGMWVVLAWARRQSQQALLDEPPSIGPDPAQTSLAVDSFATEESYGAESEQQTFALAAAAETNAAPQAAPTFDAPDDTTGVVAGSLNATDADGDALTYAVTGAPTGGTVTVDQAGTFVYTPTQATRLKAGSTAGGDIDSFTVTISDGQTTTAVPVTVAVSNEVTSVDSIAVGTNPTGVATTTTATGTYVANQSSNTVSVIDSTNQVVSTITGFSAPTGVAASPDGSKVYVTNRSTGKVSVIDTSTNKVVSTITVGSAPTGVAVNPVDGRVYVTNTNSGTVSVINPATNAVTNTIPVGSAPTGVAVGDDGRVYVANRSSGTMSVISPTSNSVIKTVTVGSSPSYVAVSPDGDRVYVTNNTSNTVTVIDTTTTAYSLTKITVGSQPYGVAVSPDGSLVYVANANDTVSVIDAATKTVTQTLKVDPTAKNSTHLIAVSPDGNTVYVTDNYTSDKAVRVISLKHVNAAPVTTGAPTASAPDENGVVTGQVNITDPDGDKLTYTVTDPPDGGTVTVDAATGTYTYTPTVAARQAAYDGTGEDTDGFTVTASDGQYTKAVAVTVPISPAPPPDLTVTTTPIPVGANPTGVAVIGPTNPNDSTPHHAYVVNSGDFTVSVIDTDPSSATYNHVITTIPVGYYPTGVAASPEGDRVYVGNYDTVSVIDTTTNAVAATIPVPSDGCGQGCYNGVWDVAVSPDGDVLYAAVGDNTVSKIDTNTYDIISTTPVGFWDGDMELSPDGSRLYAADGVSDTVVVYDTATMQQAATVDVGPNQQDYAGNVAISLDGTRAYAVVLNGFVGDVTAPSTVSVIDTDPTSATYNTTIATITVPDGAQGVAVSTDGSRAYVTHSDGKTITVIDTTTNTVIGTFTTDQNPTAGSQYITVGPDDTLYITDQADGTTYAVTVGDATAL